MLLRADVQRGLTRNITAQDKLGFYLVRNQYFRAHRGSMTPLLNLIELVPPGSRKYVVAIQVAETVR